METSVSIATPVMAHMRVFLRRYADRVSMVHMEDVYTDSEEVPELGEGDLDIDAVGRRHATSAASGSSTTTTSPATRRPSTGWPPPCSRDAPDSARATKAVPRTETLISRTPKYGI